MPITTATTTWRGWVSSTCTSTATTGTADPWIIWVDNSTCATTTTCTSTDVTAWTTWIRVYDDTCPARRQTRREAAEVRRREKEYQERQKAEAERYRAAKERAEGLLYEHLTDEQRAEIKRHKFFVVRGGKTGRKYKINADGGLAGNVHELDEAGALKRRLCAHISHAANAPIFDHLLAQKLMLEYQEEDFLRVANDHGR